MFRGIGMSCKYIHVCGMTVILNVFCFRAFDAASLEEEAYYPGDGKNFRNFTGSLEGLSWFLNACHRFPAFTVSRP